VTHPLEVKLNAMEDARKRGVNAASRRYKIASSTLSGWLKDADEVPEIGVMPALHEAEIVNGLEVVEGLPPKGTVAYIDPANISRAVDLAQLYSARRRADLRIELADTAVHLAKKLQSADLDGKDANGLGLALSKVVEALRLESGQVSSLKGVVDIRRQLDEEQAREAPVSDLTVAIEATSLEDDADEA
jgi:hypothetical protein